MWCIFLWKWQYQQSVIFVKFNQGRLTAGGANLRWALGHWGRFLGLKGRWGMMMHILSTWGSGAVVVHEVVLGMRGLTIDTLLWWVIHSGGRLCSSSCHCCIFWRNPNAPQHYQLWWWLLRHWLWWWTWSSCMQSVLLQYVEYPTQSHDGFILCTIFFQQMNLPKVIEVYSHRLSVLPVNGSWLHHL